MAVPKATRQIPKTGEHPKGAPLTHANLLASAHAVRIAWRWVPEDRLALSLPLSPTPLPSPRKPKGTIRRGHHLERIVAGNEPAVSGGLGSQVITHNDDDAM